MTVKVEVRAGATLCQMCRVWGKPWRSRRGGPVPDFRPWIVMPGETSMLKAWKDGNSLGVGSCDIFALEFEVFGK